MFAAQETLEEIDALPQSSTGAPLPALICDEHNLFLLYLDSAEEKTVIIKFQNFLIYKFGSPNDEALAGHPLYKAGLMPYGAFKVQGASWIAELEKMNAVHPRHNKDRFNAYSHFIFTFHDSTFECISMGMEFKTRNDTVKQCLRGLVDTFR
ncbi:MAG: hypothetical protein GC185_13130 [Alphaproteobacteria bacterium]|nr:hypothetical protein [Alphaproteobacteria bacterium]